MDRRREQWTLRPKSSSNRLGKVTISGDLEDEVLGRKIVEAAIDERGTPVWAGLKGLFVAAGTTPDEKTCAICGVDCSNLPRKKDERGRYYCLACLDRIAAQTQNDAAEPPARSAPTSRELRHLSDDCQDSGPPISEPID